MVAWQAERCWFDPQLRKAECRGVPEQDASPKLLPTSWLLPCVVNTAVGIRMCEREAMEITLDESAI